LLIVLIIACASLVASDRPSGRVEWPNYGNDAGGMRYSPLTQINRHNVSTLTVAWEYHTGDVSDGTRYPRKSEFESTPIFVDGTLYLTTAFNRVVALDPATGRRAGRSIPKSVLSRSIPKD
jgi:quinoprotein glucose dehydrogenase